MAAFERSAVELCGLVAARAFYRCRWIYKGVQLAGKRVLDIGAGMGIQSAYAIARGAKCVVAIEPEAAGSTKGSVSIIRRIQHQLGAPHFEVVTETIQNYDSAGQTFDIVLSHNSVNHLDESRCMALGHSEQAREVYRGIFRRITEMMVPNGKMIITDCSRRNFFRSLGLKSPLMPQIEWEKHQTPRTWTKLLEPLGFEKEHLSWYTFYPLRHLRGLLDNATAAFFLGAIFRLVLRYPGEK